jgi:tetratricopeptide (TPR) repeat protein
VLVSEEVQRMLRGEPPTKRIGERTLAGTARAVAVYRLAPRGAEAGAGPPAFVGREGEMQQLLEAQAQAAAGVPRCVLVSGEAGIGKSRLVGELRRHRPATWLVCRCLPEDQDTPLRPWIDLLGSLDVPLDALAARCGLDAADVGPILAVLLGRAQPTPAHSRERQQEMTLETLVSLAAGLARADPVGLIVEDLQWADPSTLEVLDRLAREIHGAALVDPAAAPRLLVLATARTEFTAAWPGLTRIELARLAPSEVERMVTAGLVAAGEVPRDALEQVVQRSDGVPLFVEEVTRVLVERTTAPPERGVPIEIPSTLRSLLSARLGSLSPDARETAQLAAALGRDFDEAVLARVSPKDADTLRADLAELVERELVVPRKTRPVKAYVFKHALLRDAAYESMLRPARRGWHERIARALFEHFPQHVESRPELLAWHLEEAGDAAGASDQRKRAGDRAAGRGAYLEAIRHFEKGAALVARLAPDRERTRRQLALDESLGAALAATRGYAATEVQETFVRARTHCTELGDEIPFRVLWGLWAGQITAADARGTAELVEHLRRLAAADPHPVHRLGAHAAIATRALYQCEFETALAESRTALTWWETPEAESFARETGYDIGIYAMAYELVALNYLGEFELADKACDRMLVAAEKSGNPYGLAIARGHAMNFFLERGDLDAAVATAAQQLGEVTEQRLFGWIGPATCTRGRAAARRGETAQGIEQIQQGIAMSRMVGFRLCEGLHLMGLAEAQLLAGDTDAALATIDAGLAYCAASVDRLYEFELLRLRGELHRQRGDASAAEADLRCALELVRARRARGLEPRASRALAELLAASGRRDEAKQLLTRACEPFGPKAGAADVEHARALLASLA